MNAQQQQQQQQPSQAQAAGANNFIDLSNIMNDVQNIFSQLQSNPGI